VTLRSPSLPYVLPFVLFLALLALTPYLSFGPRGDPLLGFAVVGGTLLLLSRGVLDFRVSNWPGSIGVGIGVFALWVTPDLVAPAWRELPLFQNGLVAPASGYPAEARTDGMALALRTLRAAVLVPIVEELFWRAWLPRWIIALDFERVPVGTYTWPAFWLTAVLFASEHGAYWDVGLLAGMIYNGWMWRTRRLGDCILAHAVTNACLAAYVIGAGRWEYW